MSLALPIEVRDLSKTYRIGFWRKRTVRALQALSLEVRPGEVLGLLGPNGAGKSTTIKILMNLVRSSSGVAKLFGHAPGSIAARREVGFVPENPSPYEYLTGREFVAMAGRMYGLSGQELDRRTTEVLGAVELGAAEKLQIRRYSKGMVQRVALAQALIARPRLLILDEPTSGLDPLGRRHMRDLIFAERERGTTILFCTHIIPDVEALCDRVAVLVGGRLVREGGVQQLLSSETPVMELLLEGVTAEKVAELGFTPQSLRKLDTRLLMTLRGEDVHRLLSGVLPLGGRLLRLQPARFSLEDLFMAAMKEAGGATVGGEISR